jgi:glycosyltransferase involved in cell wall biosynthesis
MHIVHTESSLGLGGQELRIIHEALGMMARGHRATLICPPQARIREEAARRGLPVVTAAIGRKNLNGLLAMRAALAAAAPAVLVTHSSTDSWLAALARPAAPIVRARHVAAPVRGHALNRWLYGRAARHVVTTSEAIRAHLLVELRLPPAQVSSVPTGVDTGHFTPGDRLAARAYLGLPSTAPLIGIVATLRSWKGHADLLTAFAALLPAWPQARLLVIGDGPGRPWIETQARELGISSQMQLTGHQDDVRPWLRALDVFTLPSYANEGVPQALLQAMACECPVVTTDIGGIREAARHGDTALVITPRDTAALTAALQSLLRERALGARLGAAARVHVEAEHAFGRTLDRMAAIFDAVTQGASAC